MTEKQYKVERNKLDVREAESKLRQAQRNLDEGYKKLVADMECAYSNLKEELERAKIRLDVEKTCLEYAEAELARGFEA